MGYRILIALSLLAAAALSLTAVTENSTIDVYATELFIFRIDPHQMFGWSRQESLGGDQFSYRPSIAGYPDLPPWAQYTHDEHDVTGYVFGVPPLGHPDVMLEIIGLNRATYDVLRSQVLLKIHPKENPAIAQVQIKVDNLDVMDLMEKSRIESILKVFRQHLWPEAASDIYVTFLTSAVRLGARLPLKPEEKEGAVIYVGSSSNASNALRNLETELKPLTRSMVPVSPMPWEPPPLLGASPPRMAGDVGLVAGRRRRPLQRPMTPPPRPPVLQMNEAIRELDPALQLPLDSPPIWSRLTVSEVPERTYGREIVISVLMPLTVLVALIVLLSMILCFHHDEAQDDSSVHFESLFDFCDDLWREKPKYSPDSQMVRYEAVQRATSTLRSLSRPRELDMAYGSPTVISRYTADRDIGRRPLPPPYTGINRSAPSASYVSAEYRPTEEPKTWFC